MYPICPEKYDDQKKDNARKGMSFSTDFMISAILFFAVVSLTYMSWQTLESKSQDFQEYNYISDRANYITELLVRTEGYPGNWTPATVKLPGLLDNNQYISTKKLDSLSLIDSSYFKSMWALGDHRYNLTIYNSSSIHYSIGIPLDESASQVVSKSRLVLYNDSDNMIKTNLRFILWR